MLDQSTPSQAFSFNTHVVRTVTLNGDPWFVAKDVCDVLGLTNPSKAVASLDNDEVTLTTTEGSHRRTNVVSESGLYALIFQSRRPEAKAFRKWVTGTVLPALRRDGMYVQGEENVETEDDLDALTARVLNALQKKIEDKEKQLAEAQPKADAFIRNMTMDNGYGLQEYARSKGLGPNKFSRWLQDQGFISKKQRYGKTYFTPYAAKNRGGVFETVKHQHGQLVRITPTGVLFFDNMVEEGKLDHLRS